MPTAFRIAQEKTSLSLHVSCLLYSPPSSTTPAFAISLPRGWYGEMLLHAGPTASHPALATVAEQAGDSVDFVVVLPAAESLGVVGRSEVVRHVMTVKRDAFWFGIRVGSGNERRSEKFEWRHSRGSEVRSVGQAGVGWKLVRLGRSAPGGEEAEAEGQTGMEAKEAKEGFTKDGKEIVAVWAQGKTLSGVKNMGEVRFLGAGATGEFGIQWSIMAVMSCFCIWLRTSQQSTTMAGV